MGKILTRPSELLLNETIGSGWKVMKRMTSSKSSIDGNYSAGYIVEKEEEEAFLKVVDLYDATIKVCDKFEEIEKITRKANNEKAIAEFCTNFRMKHVLRFVESGEFETTANKDPLVHYIIYEKAKQDCFSMLGDFGVTIDQLSLYKRLSILHNVSNALRSMHYKDVVHQDLKPSNILQFVKDGEKEIFKIGDFDSAIRKSKLTLKEELENQEDMYCGTYRFAPIDLLYDYVPTEWEVVRKGTDFYLLGSLICFYFTGRSLTEMFKSKLGRAYSWERSSNKGKFLDLLPSINIAFESSLNEVCSGITERNNMREIIYKMLRVLCHPNPNLRGERINSGSEKRKLTLIPTVSRLGNLMTSFKGE